MNKQTRIANTAARSLSAYGPNVVALAREQADRTGCAVYYVTQHGAAVALPHDNSIYPYASVLDAQAALDAMGWGGYYEPLEVSK
jgi:hypothetical protein